MLFRSWEAYDDCQNVDSFCYMCCDVEFGELMFDQKTECMVMCDEELTIIYKNQEPRLDEIASITTITTTTTTTGMSSSSGSSSSSSSSGSSSSSSGSSSSGSANASGSSSRAISVEGSTKDVQGKVSSTEID